MADALAPMIRLYFGGLANVVDDALDLYIADGRGRILLDAIATTHDNYETLLRYATGSIMVTRGVIQDSAGAVVSEKVADVEIKYGDSSAGNQEDANMTYEEWYLHWLRAIQGMNSRIGGGEINAV